MTIFLNQLVRKRLEILTLSLCLLTAWNPAFAEKTVLVLNRLSLANVEFSYSTQWNTVEIGRTHSQVQSLHTVFVVFMIEV